MKPEKSTNNLVGHPVNSSRNGMEEKRINDIGVMRRSQLTKATYKVVSRKGYYNFTIKDIAKEAGLSEGLGP